MAMILNTYGHIEVFVKATLFLHICLLYVLKAYRLFLREQRRGNWKEFNYFEALNGSAIFSSLMIH